MENNKPKIRFKGFDEDWEEKKLSDIADIIGGGTPSTGISEYWNGNIDWYSPSEIGEKNFAHGSVKKITGLGLENSSAKILPANKTILFTSRAGIGNMTILSKEGATNQGFQSLVLKSGNNTYFIYSAGFLIKKYALSKASGSTFLEISSKILGAMDLPIPKNQIEQQKIGNFFENLDKLITEHQQKHSKLRALKKAMLYKMFPQQGQTVPEIRFKGFSGEWEEIKLGDKVPVRGGFAFKSNCFRKSGIPILKISNILPSGEVGGNFDYYEEIEQDINISLPNNSAVIAMSGATTGKVSILKISENEKVYQNQRVGYFENKNLVDYSFISTLVKSSLFERKMKSVLVAGAQPNVSPKEIDSFEFLIPKDKKEQRKIGEYFINLDEIIINYDIQILKLQNIKKAFLAKMFI